MSDRPASWRMPTPKQMDKLAAGAPVGRNASLARPLGPGDDTSSEYWDAIVRDAPVDDRQVGKAPSRSRLSEIPQHVLRVSCRRCERIIEIQKADAVRLYGPDAVWRDAGHRLLDDICQQRTGRHEEDGCWPSFDT